MQVPMDGKQPLGFMSLVTIFPMMCLRCEDILVKSLMLSLSVEFDAWRIWHGL